MYNFTDSQGNDYKIEFYQDNNGGPHVWIKTISYHDYGTSTTSFGRKLIPETRTIVWEDCIKMPWITLEAVNYVNKLYKNKAFL